MTMNKFNARKVKLPTGEVFDSRKEADRWCQLKLLERAGKIDGLCRQVRFVLIPAQIEGGKVAEREVCYVADFLYHQDGKLIVEDAKGLRRGAAYELFVIKRKLMRQVHGIQVVEV